jgi:putative transposase
MRSRYKILDDTGLYFITSTIVEWIPIFTNEKYFSIITNSLKFCKKEKGLKVYAYVILDNHIHLVISGENLINMIQSFKRHTAKIILETLKADNKDWILNQFHFYKKRNKIKSDYQVWQEGYHPQGIGTSDMLYQKINYIHFNPVKRGLVLKPEDWRYSSANYFVNGEMGDLELDELY